MVREPALRGDQAALHRARGRRAARHHPPDYGVARDAAEAFYARLRELFEQKRSITTFGPYSPGQAVAMKRMGIEGIYLGGWATSAKGSAARGSRARPRELPAQPGARRGGADRARAAHRRPEPVPRARAHDRGAAQGDARRSTSGPSSSPTPTPATAATRTCATSSAASSRSGVPGYHIEDQKPGVKKCGHQGGKVLVSEDEQIKRLSAARFQLDIMGVPGIIVARTDAESATLLDGRSDERDQPFILGATNLDAAHLQGRASSRSSGSFHGRGIEELSGHQLYAMCDEEYAAADAWLERTRLRRGDRRGRRRLREGRRRRRRRARSTRSSTRFVDVWQARGRREDLRRGRRRA